MIWHKNWKLEYSVALLIVLGLILYFLPLSFENTRQANFISKWNEIYNKADYMFQVINAHITDKTSENFENASDPQEREKLLLELVKPYLRINTEKTVSKHYKPKYMNGARVYKGQIYYFDDLFFTEHNMIVGIKDLPSYETKKPAFIMMFDINGIIPPNTWGKDIFGINIFDNGRREPFGQGLSMGELKQDCSKSGTGISCSYYYKIGGGFTE
ncbi:MAG: hypothetical protein LBK53_07890 [Heliobacteriaceae bacterium]|nr:hypothetical protein [Heliobacteriaceae bacterium]